MTSRRGAVQAWPDLPWHEWGDSLATLHMWTQIVGKVRLAAAPPASHWWHAPLYVSSRGLTTSAVPYGERLFQIDFDFIAHRLFLTESGGRVSNVELAPKSVARFYAQVMDALRTLDIELPIRTKPVEVAEAIPFEEDELHTTYDAGHVEAFWGALLQAHRVLAAYQPRFIGKVSPVQFFWGSFDLATTRFSGRRAPTHAGGAPNCPPWVMEEAYSHELSNAAKVHPAAATYQAALGEFVLRHEDVRLTDDPATAVTPFLEDTYAWGADLAGWPREALDPVQYPADGAPTHAWSTSAADMWFRS